MVAAVLKMPWIAKWFGVGIFVVVIIFGSLSYEFGSFAAARAYLRGERLVFLPRNVELGVGNRGEQRQIPLQITNLSGSMVSIVGAKSSCGCVLVGEAFPAEIPPRASRKINVRVTFTGANRDFVHLVHVYGAGIESPMASAMLSGTVLEMAKK